MTKDKKIPLNKIKISENTQLFKCPICQANMHMQKYKSLLCEQNHCFDLSKNGYINFLQNSVKTEYDKSMFESRSIICKSGFFAPLIEKICKVLLENVDFDHKKVTIFDAGCGEGTHLAQIIETLAYKNMNCVGVGLDLSKEGIHIAAREYKDCIWCVGDLTKNPFADEDFHIILDILSPSNYAEFDRILAKNGYLIKVVPNANYLVELREAFYENTNKETYSNEKVIKHFQNNYQIIHTQSVQYQKILSSTLLSHLIKMTPLSWQASEEKIAQVLHSQLQEISVDLTLLIGQKR